MSKLSMDRTTMTFQFMLEGVGAPPRPSFILDILGILTCLEIPTIGLTVQLDEPSRAWLQSDAVWNALGNNEENDFLSYFGFFLKDRFAKIYATCPVEQLPPMLNPVPIGFTRQQGKWGKELHKMTLDLVTGLITSGGDSDTLHLTDTQKQNIHKTLKKYGEFYFEENPGRAALLWRYVPKRFQGMFEDLVEVSV